MSLLQRVLNPVVDVRKDETVTALLMFAYAFLAMTAYNIIQPLTRSKLISDLGAVNVPWVIFGSGLFIGVLMLGYTRLVSILPKRWALPITQAGMAVAMLGFWVLFQTDSDWVSVGVLRLGSAPRDSADQPVLDAGQRHLRSAPGEAALRLHRWRRDARRHDRRRSDRGHRPDRGREHAPAVERLRTAGVRAWSSRSSSAGSSRRPRWRRPRVTRRKGSACRARSRCCAGRGRSSSSLWSSASGRSARC